MNNLKERFDLRSQFQASTKPDNISTFTTEQNTAKEDFLAQQDREDRKNQRAVQSAWEDYGQTISNANRIEETWQLSADLPLIFVRQVSESEREKILSALRAKKAEVKAESETVVFDKKDPIADKAQTQKEITRLVNEAPANLTESLANLIAWVIDRLPKKAFATTSILTILTLLLSACVAEANPTKEVPTFAGPTATEATPATPEPTTASIISTATAEAAKTQEASRADAFIEAYFAGQSIDVSQLSPTEYKEFSIKLAEKMNEQRGINPVLYKNEAYIHPDNLMMFDYDGHPDMNETITMYLAIAGRDAEGNLQIINEKGQTVTIANSADVDWNMVVTDPNDPRIDLANTGGEYDTGLTSLQTEMLSINGKLIPMVLLDKSCGLVHFDANRGGTKSYPILHFLKIETDQNNNPVLAKKILIFPAYGSFVLFQEGESNMYIYNSNYEISGSEFYNNLDINSVYYFNSIENQDDLFEKNIFANLDNYIGLTSGNEAFSSLIEQTHNDNNIIMLGNATFIIKN